MFLFQILLLSTSLLKITSIEKENRRHRMDLSSFKLDIDELIGEFAQRQLTTFADMKRVWLARKFSYIYEASPSSHLTYFMQTLYAQAISHMLSSASLSHRLGGLYCLYCLHEIQPFKPPYRIYLSLGELKSLKNLVMEAMDRNIIVVAVLVKQMLEKNMFIFGSMDLNDSSATARVNQLTELQNTRAQVAYEKLFSNTQIEHFLHMDVGTEVDLDVVKTISREYADSKKIAIREAKAVVDIENIKHIAEDDELLGEKLEKAVDGWNNQKEAFYKQTGISVPPLEVRKLPLETEQQNDDDDSEGFDELEQLIFQA